MRQHPVLSSFMLQNNVDRARTRNFTNSFALTRYSTSGALLLRAEKIEGSPTERGAGRVPGAAAGPCCVLCEATDHCEGNCDAFY